MPSTIALATEQQEPTLRDVLNAVIGLGTKVGSLETRMGSFETKMVSLETKVDSLEAEVDSVETRMGSLETKVDSLKVDIYEVAEQTAKHIISAISDVKEELGGRITRVEDGLTQTRSDVASLRKMREVVFGVQQDVEIMRRSLRHIEPHVEETVKLGRSNRDALQTLTADVAKLDRRFDLHTADSEIHLPRPRTMPTPDAGPIAA